MTIDYEKVLTGIDQIKNSIVSLKSQLDKIGNNTGIPKLNKQIQKSSGFSKTLKGIAGIGTAVVTGRKMIRTLQGMTEESVNFVETSNLFSVSMGKGLQSLNGYYEKAVRFQNELQEKLGVNIAESMNYQALFNSMSKSMGISAKYSYILSENFTKLGYDLASLYNIDPENAMQKLRAGLAGQTKPLRDLGLDITQQSLQPIVDELGINRSIKNMSQAEKMILRYIAVLKQAQIAQGDFANTMDSPANQLRIFNAQVIAFKRNMGNLWQGFLGGILPYVNAVMMVINELLKMVAKLFGFKVSDQKVNLSANIGADDLASDLGTASGKAKELKNQLMGFDEINNISLPSSSGGGSGGVSGGIDQRLLDAMKEYDNLMDKVKDKSTKIRDKIMQWLGFTKKINPLTGEISWEYTGMSKQAKTILGILKAIVGLYIGTKLLKFIGWLNTLRKVLLGTQEATTSFQVGLALLGKRARTTWTVLKLGVEQIKIYMKNGDGFFKALGKTNSAMLSLIPNTVKVTGGIAGLTVSTYSAFSSMKKLGEGSAKTGETIGKLSLSVAGATASGALLGSTFGPAGTAIGALAGATVSLTASLLGYATGVQDARIQTSLSNDEVKKLTDNLNKSKQAYENTIDSIKNSAESKLIDVERSKELSKELKDLVDSNGKVKKGYEETADYILGEMNEALGTELSRKGDLITINGKVVNSYEELKESIEKTVKAKKEEIRQEAILELNKEKMKRKIQLEMEIAEAKKKAQKAATDFYNAESEGMNGLSATFSKKQKDICNRMIETNNTVKSLSNEYEAICGELKTTTDLMTSDIVKDYSKIADSTIESLNKGTKAVNDLTPEQQNAWRELATNNYDEYKNKLNQLSPDVQKEIQKMTGIIVQETNNAVPQVEKASSSIYNAITKDLKGNLTINFGLNADYSGLKKKLTNMKNMIDRMVSVPVVGNSFKSIQTNLNKLINQLSINGYKDGGFPVSGEMFVARENGLPEMVGRIGNRTSVANNGQIIEGIKAGVYEAVMSANSQNVGTRVSLDVRADEGIIVKKASKGFKEYVEQTGELPFPVPV